MGKSSSLKENEFFIIQSLFLESKKIAMKSLSPKKEEISQLKRNILMALVTQSPRPYHITDLPPQHLWLTTRELADAIDVDIYQARRLLISLVDDGKLLVTDGVINNSLRWYPIALRHANKNDEDKKIIISHL